MAEELLKNLTPEEREYLERANAEDRDMYLNDDLRDVLRKLAELREVVAAAPCSDQCASRNLYCPSCGALHPADRDEWCCAANRYGTTTPTCSHPCNCWKSRLK
jgi:hypothetical protein